MKKKLLLVPVISLGLFGGLTGGVSAAETENTNQIQTLSTINTYSSIHDKASELKNGGIGNSYTDSYRPIKYYKFYFDGYDLAYVNFTSKANHKMTILNGDFIKIGDEYHDIVSSSDLTKGWNYIEIVDTMPSTKYSSYFDLKVTWR
ncbi:hypothetical protein [Lysinibacillus sp. Ag94]|uniref:hypothetical protein n=1 Tax=Lysinibacillus sp. Ag94 TaxID=2936682 RepID=UPI00200F101C|nr:hypothetical protein [Lysinibacillus sp. Ag94]UPW82251.1 hypothetical protein MY533_16060 [Lysinibacillus sp. Ag94]